MPPRRELPRRSKRLEHNQCHGPFNFFPASLASSDSVASFHRLPSADCQLSRQAATQSVNECNGDFSPTERSFRVTDKHTCGVGLRSCWITQSDNGEPLLRPYIRFADKPNSM